MSGFILDKYRDNSALGILIDLGDEFPVKFISLSAGTPRPQLKT
jgi:hypothetical protein